ncbi:PHP domain-containing protein [Chloroflexota bacterium]
MLKADLHIHTRYSMDCDTPVPKIIERCGALGINCIAVADHGTIEGALEMQKAAPFTVIVAEEILTPHGEIMGMFLKEGIPSRIPIEKAIEQIRAQDGLVAIPHPFDKLRGMGFNSRILEEIVASIDIIEVFNARTPLQRYSERAQNFARQHNLVGSAGSDAHSTDEIGNAYLEMPEFNSKDEFLQALDKGKIFGHRSSLLVHFYSNWARLKKAF